MQAAFAAAVKIINENDFPRHSLAAETVLHYTSWAYGIDCESN